MDESVVVISACDGIGIIVQKSKDKDLQAAHGSWSSVGENDPLMRKRIETKWNVPSVRKSEIHWISNNTAIIALDSAAERKDLLKIASTKIQNNLQFFNQPISLGKLCDEIGNELNQISFSKMFGDRRHGEVILVGWSIEFGAEIFCIEADGTRYKYQACAIGGNKEEIKMRLGPFVNQNISTNQCLVEGLKILMNASCEDFDFELVRICSETQGNFERCSDDFCKLILCEAIKES